MDWVNANDFLTATSAQAYYADCCSSWSDRMFDILNRRAEEEAAKTPHKEEKMKPALIIEKVIFDGPATIVFWNDDTKTVVKCTDGDNFAYDVGVAMATLKKLLGKSYAPYRTAVRKKINEFVEKKNKESKVLVEKAAEKEAKCGNCTYKDVSVLSQPCITCMSNFLVDGKKTSFKAVEND